MMRIRNNIKSKLKSWRHLSVVLLVSFCTNIAHAENTPCAPIMGPLNYCTDAFSVGGPDGFWTALYPGSVQSYHVSSSPFVALDIAILDFTVENPKEEDILKRIYIYFSRGDMNDPLSNIAWRDVEMGPYTGYQMRFDAMSSGGLLKTRYVLDAYLDPENDRLLVFTTLTDTDIDALPFHIESMQGVTMTVQNTTE